MPSPLLTSSNRFNLSAIMLRAWEIARAEVVSSDRCRRQFPSLGLDAITVRQAFAAALRKAWGEARGALNYLRWSAERDAEMEARKLLDDRTREILSVRDQRATADGIDSTVRFLATVRQIDARLAALGAR